MFILSRDTVSNRAALDIRRVPYRFLGRVTLWPRSGGWRLWLRLVFEIEFLRYLAALLPFVFATLIWPQYALAIAQAPIPMLILVYLVESRLLRATPARRQTLVGADEADRGLDLLRSRARNILSQIAARRGLDKGVLHLVIEQSDLLRVPPLTLVSVQHADGPGLLSLDAGERALVTGTLFQPPLGERDLQRIGIARRIEIHDLTFAPEHVSAHARLAALMQARREAE